MAALVDKLGPPRDRPAEGAQASVASVDPGMAQESEAAKPASKPADEVARTPPPVPEQDSPLPNPHKRRRTMWAWLGGVSLCLVVAWLAFTLSSMRKPRDTTAMQPPAPTSQPVVETATPSPNPGDSETSPTLPDMVRIKAGTFQMGGSYGNEAPRHSVTFDEYDRYARATGAELPGDEGWGRAAR